MTTLVTGIAGFIGSHLARNLLNRGDKILGIDNISSYYDVNLKYDRLNSLKSYKNFTFEKIDISNYLDLTKIIKKHKVSKICHLAAQAGVRYSLEAPMEYIKSNIVGHLNMLEICRNYEIKNIVYASSSSVYGGNTKVPFSISDRVDSPVSLYAATKRSDELMSYTYNHLYGINTIGLRFFTVYGPWGRPDMATWIFTKKIILALKQGKNIEIRGFGTLRKKNNKAKEVRNPKTNEKLFKSDTFKLHFRIGKVLHNKLNSKHKGDE